MQDVMTKLFNGDDLEQQETQTLFQEIIQGKMTEIEISALLVALKLKGEVPAEIAGAAQALRNCSLEFDPPNYLFADIVGTGGDGAHTINISTAVSFIAAEAGLPIAKHGNRSVSSLCGAADLLEQFGVKLDMSPKVARRCLDENGVTFLFAPHYHSGMRHAMPVRKALATRTVFNILGPLVSPARPQVMLVGVYEPNLCKVVAETLHYLGCKRALVVHGLGLDEIALHGQTQSAELDNGEVILRDFSPADFGVQEFPLSKLVGGSPMENKQAIEAILSGKGDEVHNAAVAVNTAALLTLAGVTPDFSQGYQKAMQVIQSGKAMQRLERFVELSNQPE